MSKGEEGVYTNKPMGINKKRGCTDILFLLLFVCYWVGMWIVAGIGINTGDPRKLIIPQDYLGQYCGVDNSQIETVASSKDLTNFPYLFYLNPLQLQTSKTVCISECPSTTQLASLTNIICDYDHSSTDNTKATYIQPASEIEMTTFIITGECSLLVYDSAPVLQRCVPLNPLPQAFLDNAVDTLGNQTLPGTSISADGILSNGRDIAMKVVADIMTAKWVIVAGCAGSVLVCFIYLYLMRLFARLIIYVTLLATNLVLISLSVWLYFFWQNYETWYAGLDESIKTDMDYWEVKGAMAAFIVVAIIAGVVLLITIVLRKRISIAIEIIKEAAKSISSMPMILFYPLVNFVLVFALLMYFIAIYFYLITPNKETTSLTLTAPSTPSVNVDASIVGVNGTIPEVNQSATIEDSNLQTYLQYYHIFGCLWGWGFLLGVGQITFAGAIATYYWTLDKRSMSYFPVVRSFVRTLRYHLGSVCLGSLLLAIVQMIRVILWSIKKQAVGIKKVPFMSFVFCCADCCLQCVEKVVKWINKQAYIMIAINGSNFCKSAISAFGLIIRNALRIMAVNFVSSFVMFLGKISIAAGVFFATWGYIQWQKDSLGLTFTFVPAIVTAVVAYAVSIVFLNVYDMAIDTIFMCFLEDSERNDGSEEKPYYMSKALMRITNVSNKTGPETSVRTQKVAPAENDEF